MYLTAELQEIHQLLSVIPQHKNSELIQEFNALRLPPSFSFVAIQLTYIVASLFKATT